jgi:FtsP/CotA-like multicopper oxidase with cupredoxin domain
MVNFHQPTRRRLLQSAGLALAAHLIPGARADNAQTLTVTSRMLDVKGKPAKVYGIINRNGGHGLNWVVTDEFAVNLRNDIAEETLVHWHGLTPPITMDGVPMLSGPTLQPGETRNYRFPNRNTGTHWMHSHVGLQEQGLLAAPLIIREAGEALVDEQEHVVMLHDFTFRDPQEILAELKGGGGAHAGHDMSKMGHDMSKMAEGTAMPGMVNDIVFDAMLANDRTLDDPEVVQVEKSGHLRLRIINAAAASNMWIDLGQLEGRLIAVDGKAVRPVMGSRFPLAIAQRADIRLALPQGAGVWPILFKAEGSALQSGILLKAGDAQINKLSDQGEVQSTLDLSLESQLVSLVSEPDIAVSRSEMVMLTGGGADYVWGLNGKTGMHDVIFNVREGERYEVMFHNMTSMAHPMHLHGHYFKVVGIDGQRIDGAVRDTVLVPVNGMVTIRFDADNPGTWAFHCHHLYHMNSGMMGSIAYASGA